MGGKTSNRYEHSPRPGRRFLNPLFSLFGANTPIFQPFNHLLKMQVTTYNPPSLDTFGSNSTAFKASQRKENNLWKEYAFFVHQPDDKPHKIRAAVTVRFYFPGQTTCYCAFWVNLGEHSIRATGKAGGYGYEKKSAAFEDAARAAGFKFSENFGGKGETAIIEAGKAILSFFGAECYHVHEANG